MKTILKVLPLIFLASSCAHVSGGSGSSADEQRPLPERVQEMVVAVQSDAIEALPAEIAGFTSSEPVADREKNQRGAGFTRVYMLDDAVVTVFLYNNQEFGAKDEKLYKRAFDGISDGQTLKRISGDAGFGIVPRRQNRQ